MTRSERARRARSASRSRHAGRGGTVLGIFIGLVLGLTIAAGVAVYLNRSGLTTPLPVPGAAKEAPRSGRIELTPQAAAPEKPRFDFYKILPGAEEAKAPAARVPEKPVERPPDRATIEAAKAAEPRAKASDRFWLQAGAFASESDAESLRARLALAGWEATLQGVTLPDKTTRYRVRLGPYDNADELNRVKTELGSRGFDASVIKNP